MSAIATGVALNLRQMLRDWRHVIGRAPARSPFEEFVRYGLASGGALATDFGTLVVLTELFGVHYLTSAAAGFALGVAVAYAFCVRWVFARRRLASIGAERAIFLVIGIMGLVLNHFVMYGLTEGAALPYALSKTASAALVFTFNFTLRKALLFTAPDTARAHASAQSFTLSSNRSHHA